MWLDMKKIIISTIIVSCLLASSIISVNAFTAEKIDNIPYNQAGNTGVERWAVIVGAGGDIFSHNDAGELNETLVNHGWQADHIKVLIYPDYNGQLYTLSTKENIINAIRWMESKEDEDDIVLFFFSGHGGNKKVLDYRGDAITCEEFNNEFDKFESNSIAIIFHSCFSGSMVSPHFVSSVSTEEEQIKEPSNYENVICSNEPDELISGTNIENEEMSIKEMDLESSGYNGLDKPGRVVLMSSGRFELSWASYLLENGVFSYFLIKGFDGEADDANQDGWISAEEVFNYAKPRTIFFTILLPLTFAQHPHIYDGYEGDLNLVQINSQTSQSSGSTSIQTSTQPSGTSTQSTTGSTTQQSAPSTTTSTSTPIAMTTTVTSTAITSKSSLSTIR